MQCNMPRYFGFCNIIETLSVCLTLLGSACKSDFVDIFFTYAFNSSNRLLELQESSSEEAQHKAAALLDILSSVSFPLTN